MERRKALVTAGAVSGTLVAASTVLALTGGILDTRAGAGAGTLSPVSTTVPAELGAVAAPSAPPAVQRPATPPVTRSEASPVPGDRAAVDHDDDEDDDERGDDRAARSEFEREHEGADDDD